MMTTHGPKRTLVNVSGSVAGVAIACDSGAAWITQCCDPTDYVLRAGTSFEARQEGKIVVQIVKGGKISMRLGGPVPEERRRGRCSSRLRYRGASILEWGRRLLRPLL